MVTIREHLVPAKYQLKSSGVNPVTTVTIHETGNEARGATANAHARLQAGGNSRKASWHATADADEVVISYPPEAKCWHAGKEAGNQTSYSIEICVNDRAHFRQACLNAAAHTAAILRARGLGVGALRQHNAWSGKDCPDHLRAGDWGVTWMQLVAMVAAALDVPVALPEPPAEVKPAPEVSPSTPASTGAPYPELLVDGIEGAVTVTAFQHLMAAIGRYAGLIDGVRELLTIIAEQEWLASLGFYTGLIDGQRGPLTRKARQRFLASKGLYTGRIDGIDGPMTIRAWQTYLNAQRGTWS